MRGMTRILVLSFSILLGGCALNSTPVVVPPDAAQITRAKAVDIAVAVAKAGELVVNAGRSADQAQRSGLITVAQLRVIDEATVALKPKALASIEAAKTVTTDAELRATTTALMDAVTALTTALTIAHPDLARIAETLRTAYTVPSVYLGRGAP